MGKVICDICGTAYPDTADSCPICGYSRDLGAEEQTEEDILLDPPVGQDKGGRFAADSEKKKNKEIFDYDEVNAGYEDEDEEEEPVYDEDEDYEEEPRSNVFLVVILVIVITLLLATTGFIFFRFFLPNMTQPEQTTASTEDSVPTQTTEIPTTELSIPCESLVLTGGLDTLTMEGGNWLLHVVVSPSDTTDQLIFVSEDESVVTVDENGKLTAVGEGETYVNILCGEQKIACHIVVDYSLATEPTTEPETIPPLTDAPEETEEAQAVGGTEATGETETAETTEPTKVDENTEATEASEETKPEEDTKATEATSSQLKNVTLKLKKTDITLAVGYSYTIPLDCDLSYEEIEWYVEETFIAKVENGKVTALMAGVTDVVAKYGDQIVECRIRCTK